MEFPFIAITPGFTQSELKNLQSIKKLNLFKKGDLYLIEHFDTI